MPRERRPRLEVFHTWFDSDPEGFKDIVIKDFDLFCTVCDRIINSADKTKVTRHLKSHAFVDEAVFFYELTEAFLASNIPLNKLENPKLRTFLEKYMDRKLPHESTLRLRYVDRVYINVVSSIRQDIADDYVYFVVNKTTDACGRSVANFLIGALRSDTASDSHLLASKILEKINHETIIKFVKDCFYSLWPNQDVSDKVLVMLSDADAYMIKAGQILSQKYKKIIHFTCPAHTLSQIAENFPLVNSFISNVKKVFIKASKRREVFRKVLPGIPLPPEPVIGRWGTWLEAVAYYDKYFDGITNVICSFNPNDSSAIQTVQDTILNDSSIREDIRYINRHYGFLIDSIRKLESHGLSLKEQFDIMHDIQKNIYQVNNIHPVSSAIKEKMQSALKMNPGYTMLEDICRVLTGTYQEIPEHILTYSSCLNNFTYCPLSSMDVERLFSIHKATRAGRPTLLSSCWYLDHLSSGGDWQKFYQCEPYDFVGTDAQKKLILGGEACMWSESINDFNVISRVWPRASATAEKLWSNRNVTDLIDASQRLEEHTCRMIARGIEAQPPNSAGYCL